MILAIITSTFIMPGFAAKIDDYVNNYPSIKILALSFLLTIGTLLVAKAFPSEIPKDYAYFTLPFSFIVKLLNIELDKKIKKTVKRHEHVA